MSNSPLKIMIILGTRPETIKLIPIILWGKEHDAFNPVLVTTAQHREMMDQVLEIFNIVPDYDLNIMSPNQSLFTVTSRILDRLEPILETEKPDIVFVQGDTTTTFVGALAAFYKKIKIAHVEAGLRTHLKYSPYPEEINRKITGTMADFHFAPTQGAKENLLREGYAESRIHVTGNTGIDTLFRVLALNNGRTQAKIDEIVTDGRKFILITAHRRESFGEGFVSICNGLLTIARQNPEIDLIYPVHLNPNVQDPVRKIMSSQSNIKLIEPLDYLTFVNMMNRSYLVITDSGGIQEEAPSLGKPVLVMREQTERPEAVQAGTAKLVGVNSETIVRETERLLYDGEAYRFMANALNPYGDGKATERIMNIVLREFSKG